MSISNGQEANATNFNNAFVSKSADSEVAGKVTLNAPASGDEIENAQQQINLNKDLSETNQSNLTSHVDSNIGHGTTSDIVGISDTQILTNKTIAGDVASFTDIVVSDEQLRTKKYLMIDDSVDVSALTSSPSATYLVSEGERLSAVSVTDGKQEVVIREADQTLLNKTIDADLNTLSNISNTEVASDAAIEWSKLDTGTVNRVLQTNASTGLIEPVSDVPDTDEVLSYDGTNYVWTPQTGGSGGSELGFYNRIDNFNAEEGLTGWALYNDGAVAEPIDGTGGTIGGRIALGLSSTIGGEVLRGDDSFGFQKATGDQQGLGISYDFTLEDPVETSTEIFVSFEFEQYVYQFFNVFIYDITNSNLIPVSGSWGNKFYSGSFLSDGTSTSYRLIFHITGTDTNSDLMWFDSVYVGRFPPLTFISPEILATSTVQVTTSGNNHWLAIPNNSLTLSAGVWRIGVYGSFDAESTSNVMLRIEVLCAQTNGTNTTTEPTALATAAGVSIKGGDPSVSAYDSPSTIRAEKLFTPVIIEVENSAAPYTIYAVPKISGTGAHKVAVKLTAEKIGSVPAGNSPLSPPVGSILNIDSPTTISSGNEHWMTVSNNSVTLTPGTWDVKMRVDAFAPNGGEFFTSIQVWGCEANGGNSTVQPALVGDTVGVTRYGWPLEGIFGTDSSLKIVWKTYPLTVIVDESVSSYPIYAVPRFVYSSGTHQATVGITAIRIK